MNIKVKISLEAFSKVNGHCEAFLAEAIFLNVRKTRSPRRFAPRDDTTRGVLKSFVIFLCLFSSTAFPQNAMEAYNQSLKKLAEKDTAAFLQLAQQAYNLAPTQPNIMVNLAKAFAMTGKKTKSIELLDDISVIGFDYDVQNDSGFKNIWKHSLLPEITLRAKKSGEIITSDLAYTLNEKDLIPEGITYDPRQQRLYISSIYKRKIVFVNSDGTSGDLFSEAQDGLYSTLGMKVDAARNQLWVAGILNSPKARLKNPGEPMKAAVFQYNLETKKLVHQYSLNDTLPHLFNDLVIVNGSVFVTDTKQSAVYKIVPSKKTIDLWYQNGDSFSPNGIAVSQDQRYLFVAQWSGITRIAIADTQHIQLQTKAKTTLSGIDGLYFYNNNLIAIQNGVGPQSRVVRFELNKEMNSVVRATILESGNPLFNIPTTGVIVNDELYFIANSQLRSFTADGTIYSDDKLQPTIILKLPLVN
jgi:sugar lactone lactonase YvrE